MTTEQAFRLGYIAGKEQFKEGIKVVLQPYEKKTKGTKKGNR